MHCPQVGQFMRGVLEFVRQHGPAAARKRAQAGLKALKPNAPEKEATSERGAPENPADTAARVRLAAKDAHAGLGSRESAADKAARTRHAAPGKPAKGGGAAAVATGDLQAGLSSSGRVFSDFDEMLRVNAELQGTRHAMAPYEGVRPAYQLAAGTSRDGGLTAVAAAASAAAAAALDAAALPPGGAAAGGRRKGKGGDGPPPVVTRLREAVLDLPQIRFEAGWEGGAAAPAASARGTQAWTLFALDRSAVADAWPLGQAQA